MLCFPNLGLCGMTLGESHASEVVTNIPTGAAKAALPKPIISVPKPRNSELGFKTVRGASASYGSSRLAHFAVIKVVIKEVISSHSMSC